MTRGTRGAAARRRRTPRARGARLALVASLALLAACANYDERLQVAHKQFYSQNVGGAVETLEGMVEEARGDTDERLLQLELASALQAQGRYAEASELLERADDDLEVLDYTSADYKDLAEFAFAPEAGRWRASPPERVMLNTQNMINHLARGSLGGAEVEARRMRNLVTQEDLDEDERFANPFAWALAAFVLERAGDLGEAAGARREAGDAALEPRGLAAGQQLAEGERAGTVLVVAQLGQAPIRRESRYLFPVGRTLHRLNVPSLVRRASVYTSLDVTLDGVDQGAVPVLFDYGDHTVQRYDQELPRLVAASLFQAVGRAIVAEAAAKAATKAVDDGDTSSDDGSAALAGFLVGLATSWTLAETAGCDTRCWTLLPETLGALRLEVAPGEHELSLRLGGRSQRVIRREVELEPGGLAVVNLVSDSFGYWTPTPPPTPQNLAGTPTADEVLRLVEGATWWAQILH